MPAKREILFPVFLECCQFADDIFWENIFEDLAYGKAPYGTYISKGFLSCSFKNKEFAYKIERKKPDLLYNDIYGLLTKKLGILSHKEKEQRRIDFHEMEKNIKEARQEWTSIRRKNLKDVMYEKYVLDMKQKHNLSLKNCKYLLAVILVSIMFKTITTKDITYKDDKIHSIDGIEFAKGGKIVITRPLCSLDNNQDINAEAEADDEDEKLPAELPTMVENWERFLKMLREL